MQLDALGLGVRKKTLAYLEIINDGTGTASRGNYDVRVFSRAGRLIRSGRVENWPRNVKHPVDLLAAATDAIRK